MIDVLHVSTRICICAVTIGAHASALSHQLTPRDVRITGERELAILWANQGTLVCNGIEQNPILVLPRDLTYGTTNRCHVQFTGARSNTLTLDCRKSSCIVSGAGETRELFFTTTTAK